MKIHFIIWLSLFPLAGNVAATDQAALLPENGVMDLSSIVLHRDFVLSLNGGWEFYWEKLLTPETYQIEKDQGSGIVVTVPSYWNSYEVDGELLPGMGYGTYSLMIVLPSDYRSTLCFDIPVFD